MYKAQELLAEGKRTAAKKAYEKALKTDESLIEAYAGLGKIAIAIEDWRKANGHFEKVLKHDAENFEAHYYRAICYREIGKFRPEFLRKMPLVGGLLEFKKSEDRFRWIMSRDSLYRDVIYQYAILKSYQEKFVDAINLAHKQIDLKPAEISAQVGIFEIYRQFIVRKNQKEVSRTLAGWPWYHARFFVGEKLRREKNLAQADSIFMELLDHKLNMPMPPVYLALAKSHFKQGKNKLAEIDYWRAIDSIENHVDADLIFEELKYIINDAELNEYRRIESVKEKANFFRAFWMRRNPIPAAQQNVRLAEHYRRLIYAEENYDYVGFRSWVNSPDKLNYLNFPESYRLNKEFNDKGLVYLRHGPPDDRIVTVGSGAFSNASVPASNESWKYWQTENSPEMTFHFLYDQDATGNLWRLTPFLTHPAMLEDRYEWDSFYYGIQNARSEGERFALQEEMARASMASVDTGFASDRHSWDKKIRPLEVPFTTATFRGDAGQTILEVYFGIPMLPIAKALPKEASSMEIEEGIAIHDASWRQVRKSLQNVAIPYERKKLRSDNLFTDFYRTILKPDAYFLAIHSRPQNTNLLGGHAQIDLNVPDYSGSDLSMSDIELASVIQHADKEGRLVKNGLLVVPNPTRQYARKKPVHIYFEIYNLTRDADGKTAFSIEYTVAKKEKKRKLFGLFGGGKSSISVKADRQGNNTFSAEFLAIDVQKLGNGEVVLKIQATDKHTGTSVLKENSFILY
ncbi:MAG: GWxTD domain-containing protein [bacterium]